MAPCRLASGRVSFPDWEWVREITPSRRHEVAFGNKAGVELDPDLQLVHWITADEDDLLSPVTPDRIEIGLHRRAPFGMVGPLMLRHRCPPQSALSGTDKRASLTDFANIMRACGEPEETLRPHDARPRPVDECLKLHRVERPPLAVDEGSNAVFLGLGNMVLEAVQFLEPERMLLGLLEVEATSVEHLIERNLAEIRLDQLGVRIEGAHDLARKIEVVGGCIGDLVEHDHVGELDLLD